MKASEADEVVYATKFMICVHIPTMRLAVETGKTQSRTNAQKRDSPPSTVRYVSWQFALKTSLVSKHGLQNFDDPTIQTLIFQLRFA
jgi:hypothetical protein